MTTQTLIAPARTHGQRMDALNAANQIRRKRKEYKAQLRLAAQIGSPRIMAARLVAQPPEWAQTWKTSDLLVSVPGIGRVRRDYLLRRIGVSHSRTLAGLTNRQRNGLVYLLESGKPIGFSLSFPTLPAGYEA